MGKIGLIIDSSSGISKKDAEKLGIGFIPIIININGKTLKSGVDLSTKDLYDQMLKGDKNFDISTSLPMGSYFEEAFDKILETNDKAIYLGLSYKFTGTVNAAKNIASSEKYKDKIFVMEDTQLSSPWTGFYINDFISLVKKYDNVETIFEKVRLIFPWLEGYLSPGNISWFYKGGRISKAQYIIASVLKILPILKVEDGVINPDTVIKARSFEKAVTKMCDSLKEKVNNLKEKKISFKYMTLKSNDENIVIKTNEIVKKYFNISDKDIVSTHASAEQLAHMGPGAFGVSVFVPMKGLIK